MEATRRSASAAGPCTTLLTPSGRQASGNRKDARMALDEDTVRLAKGKNLATVVTLMPGGRPVCRAGRPVPAGIVSAGCPAR